MKRVKAACICQTLHFMLKDDLGHDYAVKLVKEEVERDEPSVIIAQRPCALLKTVKYTGHCKITEYSDQQHSDCKRPDCS